MQLNFSPTVAFVVGRHFFLLVASFSQISSKYIVLAVGQWTSLSLQ